jgi:molecular chaperone Hsp33
MSDEVVRVHLKRPDLMVVGVLCSQTARRAREIHGCLPTSAGLLAEGLASAFGIAGLLAGQARVNLQITCDGPLRGLFVDADAQGRGRGYVKNPQVNFLTAQGDLDSASPGALCTSPDEAFDASGALGREGTLSVIRELKAGEFYRGSVSLEEFDLARDLERYYRESEQIATAVRLHERLGQVDALFVQAMPGADAQTVERAGASMQILGSKGPPHPSRAFDLVRPLLEQFGGESDLLAEYPLEYVCGCSAEKVFRAVVAMGRSEIEDMLAKDGRAGATCAFCHTKYEVSGDELRSMIAAIDASAGEKN